MKQHYEIRVYGRVQGVGYRYFVLDKAQALGLTGYTGNCPGGEVIVIAEGEKGNLDILIDFLKMGPPRARVEEITVSKSSWSGDYTSFTIRH